MRRILIAAAVAALGTGLAACGSTSAAAAPPAAAPRPARPRPAARTSAIQKDLYTKGVLTVATDKPAYPPWFVSNNPANGKGYESAVAYAIAEPARLQELAGEVGLRAVQRLVRAGPEEVRLRHQRDLATRRSEPRRSRSPTSYYDVQQALVALKGTPDRRPSTPRPS